MIYIPSEDYECYVVQSESVLRGYKTIPENNKTIEYRDYYINSNYIYKDGIVTFNNYTTLPICLSAQSISTDFKYRNDYVDILIMFSIYCFFALFIPLKIVMKLFKKGRL